jgi:hypothetical protein
MAENRFTFTTDDPALAAEILAVINNEGSSDAPAAPAAAAPPAVEQPAEWNGWTFKDHIQPLASAFVGKYSAAEMKRYLTEHFGVESAKHVPADQWPRLYEALKNATA